MTKEEKKGKNGKKTVRIIILIVLLAVFAVSTTFVILWLLDAARVRKEMNDLRSLIRTVAPESTEVKLTESTSESGPEESTPEETTQTEEKSDPVPKNYNRETYLKYQALYELNPDFIGWLRIPDTAVDYPVLRREGETEYYLWRNIYEENDDHGIPYMDGLSTIGESDNLYIYAHHKRDGTMFFDLEKFKEKSYYQPRKYIFFETLERGMEVYEVAVTFMIDIHNDSFNFHRYYSFTPESFDEFYREVKAR